MSKNQYKNLISNSIVFTIANIGSKMVSFVLVPIYTYVLSKEEYGTIDIMITLNSLLVPALFLSISDAVLRYAMDGRYEKKDILSAAAAIYILGSLLLVTVMPLIRHFKPEIKEYVLLLGILLICNGILQTMNQFMRASGHVKAFAANGVIYTFVFAGLNILFLVVLKLGITGYMYSMICADICCMAFAAAVSKIWRFMSLRISEKTLKVMIKYSVPLIPNALMWWIMNASDKFVIAFFLNVGANGIYAVSQKFPALVDTVHGIFNQAWQISAIQEAGSENAKEFTSKVYEVYYVFIFMAVNGLMLLARPAVAYIISADYFEAWKYVPFLLVSAAFSSLSGFLSAKLIALERSAAIFVTTAAGAVINTALNFALIPFFGINGAAIATMTGFGTVLFVRESMLKKNGHIEIRPGRVIIWAITAFQIAAYYCFGMLMSEIVMAVILLAYMFAVRKQLKQISGAVIRKIKNASGENKHE